MITSKSDVIILADSISSYDTKKESRIITFQLRYWRAIHSEVMTYRTFSRNARSSRATPIDVNIDQVLNNSYGPYRWVKNKKGMVSLDQLDATDFNKARETWMNAAKSAVEQARNLQKLGLHKQIVNRVLEPFLPIDVVLTTSEKALQHFFKQRCASDAQPEIQELAFNMQNAYINSNPVERSLHLPYYTKDLNKYSVAEKMLICAARCARVSYKTFDTNKSDPEKDLELADSLIKNNHMTPFEHVLFNVNIFDRDSINNIHNMQKLLNENYTSDNLENDETHIYNRILKMFKSNIPGYWIQMRKLFLNEY